MNVACRSWVDAGNPIETGPEKSLKEPGNFQACPQESLSIPFEKVRELMTGSDPTMQLCDARGASQFREKNIANAANITIADISQAGNGRLKNEEELKEVFAKVLDRGGELADPVMFCNSGMMASLLAFAAKTAGFQPKMWQRGYNEYLFKTK